MIDSFVMTNVSFICEIPSCVGIECHEPKTSFCHHSIGKHRTQSISVDGIKRLLRKTSKLLVIAYDLTRKCASRIIGFMLSDCDRRFKDARYHSLSIAYALKGYSFTTQTMRHMMEWALLECTGKMPLCACIFLRRQGYGMAVRDGVDYPLTLLQATEKSLA